MKKTLIIDSEIHIMHPDACLAGFAEGTREPVRLAIHEHPDFSKIKDILSADALEKSMAANNISHGIIMGMSWLDKGILDENNKYIAELVRNSGGKYRGMYIPDPKKPAEAVREIESLDGNLFEGVKLLPAWQGVSIDDESLKPIFDAVQARDMYLMIHTDHATQSLDGDTPFRLLRFLLNNPDIKVLAPHMGGMLCIYALRENIKKAVSKVTFITSVSATMKFVKYAADINPENIIFGTDFPFNHCHNQNSQIADMHGMGLQEKTARDILGEKAYSMFSFGSSK